MKIQPGKYLVCGSWPIFYRNESTDKTQNQLFELPSESLSSSFWAHKINLLYSFQVSVDFVCMAGKIC